MRRKISREDWLLIVGITLVAVGVAVLSYCAQNVLGTYREIHTVRMLRQHHAVSAAYIRPWMSIRYLSDAYAIHETALFDAIHVPSSKANELLSLRIMSRQFKVEYAQMAAQLHAAIQSVIDTRRASSSSAAAISSPAPTSL